MKTATTLFIALASAVLLFQVEVAEAQAKPAVTAAATAAAAASTTAQLLPAQSELGFTSRQMGVPVDGRFKIFNAQLAFDPKKPEAGRVAFSIDLASVALGAPELEAELAKAPWFDSKKMPQASFQSSAIKAGSGVGRYDISGKLTLKGQTRDIVVPITLTQAGAVSTAAGSFVLKRLEFKIGDGEWSDVSLVANEVTVKFKLAFTGVALL